MRTQARKLAQEAGEKYYFTGLSCKSGHIAKRFTSNGNCEVCLLARNIRWKNLNPEKSVAISAKYYKKNSEKLCKAAFDWRKNNPERVVIQKQIERTKNAGMSPESAKLYKQKHKERLTILASRYQKINKGLVNAHTALRKARKIRATPSWANLELIADMYRKGAELGMDVDHIIPLKGKLVSGLHVEANLQLLTPTENNRKYNKYEIS